MYKIKAADVKMLVALLAHIWNLIPQFNFIIKATKKGLCLGFTRPASKI